jgi:aromatic-amino-acid transaminase
MFEALPPASPDKIMALNAAFRADPRADKLDLGVGVYKDETGATPIMRAVKKAEERLLRDQTSKAYLSPAGDPAFCDAMIDLAFGSDAPRERLAAAQGVGGTGALRLLLDVVAKAERGAEVWLPEPTWPNHPPLCRAAGLGHRSYPYFDAQNRSVAFEAMTDALAEAGPGDVVLLHGCCHNPTGADLSAEQWRALAAMAVDRGFTPFLDLAYQGFGDGLEADAEGLRIMAAAVPEMLVALSCSKNFGLYRDRVGCAVALAATPEVAKLTGDALKGAARSNYSMPADHGAAVVRTILTDPELSEEWRAELDAMRERVQTLRDGLADALRTRTNSDAFDFMSRQRGMFSLTGLSPQVIETLRDRHGVYMVGDSRMNVAGLNKAQIAPLADAIAASLG